MNHFYHILFFYVIVELDSTCPHSLSLHVKYVTRKYFYVLWKKKSKSRGTDMKVSKWWQNFLFLGANLPIISNSNEIPQNLFQSTCELSLHGLSRFVKLQCVWNGLNQSLGASRNKTRSEYLQHLCWLPWISLVQHGFTLTTQKGSKTKPNAILSHMHFPNH